jgi:hypothetical protein
VAQERQLKCPWGNASARVGMGQDGEMERGWLCDLFLYLRKIKPLLVATLLRKPLIK